MKKSLFETSPATSCKRMCSDVQLNSASRPTSYTPSRTLNVASGSLITILRTSATAAGPVNGVNCAGGAYQVGRREHAHSSSGEQTARAVRIDVESIIAS